MFYGAAVVLFIVVRVAIFMFSDAALYNEEYMRGQIALEILQNGFSDWTFLFADDYSLGSFIAGLWISPFFMLFGPTLLALKTAALVFSAIGLILWIYLFSKEIDIPTGRLMGLILIFAPPVIQRYNLINMGFHAEVFFFLPLTFLLGVSVLKQRSSLPKIVLVGVLFGLICGYCLINVVGVLLAGGTIVLYFFKSKQFKDSIAFIAGGIVGLIPWIWLKFFFGNPERIFTVMKERENSILDFFDQLEKFAFYQLPQSIGSFDPWLYPEITAITIVIILFFYSLTWLGWKKDYLYKWFLLYPLIFIGIYVAVNPQDTELYYDFKLDWSRYHIPIICILLGYGALACKQVRDRFPVLHKPLLILLFLSWVAFMFSLWTNISEYYPLYRTSYTREPGYLPASRNLSFIVRQVSRRGGRLGKQFYSPLKNCSIDTLADVNLFYQVGQQLGRKLHREGVDALTFTQLEAIISEFEGPKKGLLLRGIASGYSKDASQYNSRLGLFFDTLTEEERNFFNIGLIDVCFCLRKLQDCRKFLVEWCKAHNVPISIPSINTESALILYVKHVSRLCYRCMLTPGAIRGYIHEFNKDPRSLQLLGWWLAFRIAPDWEWLYLKLGPDYSDCYDLILEGIRAFVEGRPLTTFFYNAPLYTLTAPGTGTSTVEADETIWAGWRNNIPMGGYLKKNVENCQIPLKRGWD